MKKTLLITIIASALYGSSVQAGNPGGTPDVSGGTVHFHGLITSMSCNISVNGQSADGDVYLAPAGKAEFKTNDALVRPQKFSIDVKGCFKTVTDESSGKVTQEEDNNVQILWTGGNLGQQSNSNKYLANLNNLENDAKNVYIALSITQDKTGLIDIGDRGQKTAVGADIGTETVKGKRYSYYAAYTSPNVQNISEGYILTNAVYGLNYE